MQNRAARRMLRGERPLGQLRAGMRCPPADTAADYPAREHPGLAGGAERECQY
jgi:hypothetical protein